MGALFGADGVEQYKHRKAYVEAAMKAIAEGNLGKVNLVKLWKKVKGGKGLPSPSRIRAGAKVTADMAIPPTSMGADDQDYLNRKAYVEAAVNAVATGRLGKVNLVELWKLVKGRAGLPTPSEVKAGAPITLSMVTPPASMGYDFGDDGLPEDDSDIDAVLGADDDDDMDELGFVPPPMVPSMMSALTASSTSTSTSTSDYLNRKAYVEAAVNAVATGRLGKVNLVQLWKLVKGRAGLPSPSEIKGGAPITLSMIAPSSSMGYAFGDDGLPEDDSDIDAVLGADDDDMDELGADDDEDMDDLGADDDDDDLDVLGAAKGVAIGTRNAYRRNVRDLFRSLRKNKSQYVKKNWGQVKRIWDKLSSSERREVKHPDAILKEAGKINMQMMILVTGKTKEQIERVGKKKTAESPVSIEAEAEATAMGYAFGADGLPDDDSDIDAVLGADDDDMDDLGADDDDMDDLGADEDDDDFGLDDIEMNIDLDMQRALVNRYSGADQPFPAGGAAPFPGPRMAGHEVF